VRKATRERAIDYPVAVDNDYEVWSAFDNRQSGAAARARGDSRG
jgi:hypothetical protein